jgi:ATP-dependent RNA helicase DeaD
MGRALEGIGYTTPTPIQEEVIPLVRAQRDVVGQAQTGTGKTAAFGIPLVETLDRGAREPQALVLVPTRELAVQVKDEISRLGQYRGIRAVAIFGGQAMSRQLSALSRGVHVIVATPGRLMDHMERGTIRIGKVRTVVLDEADQMLDIGFAEAINYILRQTPRSRQTLLFSATIPGPIRGLARRYLKTPAWIQVGGDAEPVDEVRQIYYEVAERDRQAALEDLLRQPDLVSRALVFRRTKVGVDRLVAYIQRRGYDAQAIHGDMSQSQRDGVMARFRSGDLRILIATNVAARGLDIPAVSHVINYDMPGNLEEYVHRIGRTARMGRDGTAITFVSEWDFPVLDLIQAHVGDDLERGSPALSKR